MLEWGHNTITTPNKTELISRRSKLHQSYASQNQRINLQYRDSVCVCVCVCERERERERETLNSKDSLRSNS